MSLFNFDAAALIGFLLVFVRMSGLIFAMPVVGAAAVPGHIKIGLAGLVSFMVAAVSKLTPVDVAMPFGRFVLLAAGETAIGLVIGFAAQLLFNAVELAGEMIGTQIGFGIVNVLDPSTNSQVSITSQFLNNLALLLFLAINGHHWFLTAAVRSFEVLPLLGFNPSRGTADAAITLTANVLVLAVRLSAPVVVTLLLLNVALGLIARTVPQMNVFIVGFPLQIAVGLFILGASIPVFFETLKSQFRLLPETALNLMRLL
ncbi:MAG: flagellar type III secretion system protein FliR [Nitrospinae bacterium]|nr:flagellar type III secretion system protein FliR [Nitrospinota bacterium]